MHVHERCRCWLSVNSVKALKRTQRQLTSTCEYCWLQLVIACSAHWPLNEQTPTTWRCRCNANTLETNNWVRCVQLTMCVCFVDGSLVADVALFNSQFNRDSFLNNVETFLHTMPDCRPSGIRDQLQTKCHVLYYPLQFVHCDAP